MFHSAFKKDTAKVVLLKVKGLTQIIVKFRSEKILCTFLSPYILLRVMKYQLRKQLCTFENERLISFSHTIWFTISDKILQGARFFAVVHGMHQKSQQGIKKIYSALKLPLCGLVVFIDMNTI